MNEHKFVVRDCYWSNDPNAGPDFRSVCARCGLDEQLGDTEGKCQNATEDRLAEVVRNYQEAFYPEFVPERVAAAIMIEFTVMPKESCCD